MIATPPASLAMRSCSFSLSYSEVVSSIWIWIWSTRAVIMALSPLPSMMVVLSLVEITLRACPRSSILVRSSFRPCSSEMTVPPVRIAISSSIALRRSPNPGAFNAKQLMVPRILFTTNTARASLSTSSPMITRFLDTWRCFSKIGTRSATDDIFLSVIRM